MSKLSLNAKKDERKVCFLQSSGDIAQLVEQMTFNHWVQGSNPCVSTKKIPPLYAGCFFCGHSAIQTLAT